MARRTGGRRMLAVATLVWLVALGTVHSAERLAGMDQFLARHCRDCHEGKSAEGGLDITKLPRVLTDRAVEQRWVRIMDRVREGEMPPRDAEQPSPSEIAQFLRTSGNWVRQHQEERAAAVGRVHARRLTRREIERSLHDLLGIDIPLAQELPEEAQGDEFDTVAENQGMSHFQLARHLNAVDLALDEAFRRALSPPDRYERDFDAQGVARENPKRRTREPEMLNGQAVVWSSGLIFYGRIPATTAPENGWYRFALTVSGLNLPETGGVWSTVRTGLAVSSAPLLARVTEFEAMKQPRTIEFEAWLPRRHMLEIRPGDTTLKKGRFAGGQVGAGEGTPQNLPGIAIDRLTMQRIHRGPDDDGVRERLFGPLAVQERPRGREWQVESKSPQEDLRKLMSVFARRAFRRPVTPEQLAPYIEAAERSLAEGAGFKEALRVGYRAILCSPRFVYLTEAPGRLDDYAIACRLSYLLTGSMPDERLFALADQGRLQEEATLRAEAERLLEGSGGRRFVEDFAAQWLDLDQIDFTEPDRKLFPEFDSIVQQAMLDETHAFLETMLRENLSVTNLIDSDFTFLNSRLARHYRIPDVEGDELRRVIFPAESHRGGVLTQGAILKVTANGSNTSPVVRGVWVLDRLLGQPAPPPPESVPAIEPDIRGAQTIRELLAKHRSDASCASCHVKIDPPGFALENFDPAGQFRDRYLQIEKGRRTRGPTIDASYTLADGRPFQDVEGFRSLIVSDPEQLVRAVAGKLLVYGTGGPLTFADREQLDRIASAVAADSQNPHGFRSILLAVVTSPVFLSK